METERQFYYHYIPKIPTKAKAGSGKGATQIIGIIDASYSMHDVWPMLVEQWNALVTDMGEEQFTTICFDNELHHKKETPFLTPKIGNHGGRSTNIKISFDYIEDHIFPKMDTNAEIKIIFVSDGQDNQNPHLEMALDKLQGGKGRDISFLCLGVLSGFPTFISMKLRGLYHSGDDAIPSIFLIEYASDKAFFNKFQSIREFLKPKQPIAIEPAQLFFPWEGLNDIAKEGQWIFSKEKQIKLLPEDQEPIILNYKTFNVEAVSEIIRSWVQKLQLDSLNKKLTHNETVEYAQSTKGLVDAILEEVKSVEGLDLLAKTIDPSLSFHKRVLNQQVAHSRVKVEGYLADLNKLVQGDTPQKMNEFDAAKMIGLGTIVGKYQQKALALKNITREEFAIIKEEFIATVNSLKSELAAIKQNSNSLKSTISGMSFIDTLNDETLEAGLSLLNTQYDLMETFPIPGIAFNLKRFERATEIAFMVKVSKMPDIKDKLSIFKYMIDTVFLNDNPDYIQKVDDLEVNCVLPLLSPDMHESIAPIFETRLWNLMMTFNTMGNIDKVDEKAYVALLSTVYLWCLEKYNAREKIAKMILETFHVLYAAKGTFFRVVDDMEKDASKFFLDKENKKVLSIVFAAVDYMTAYRKFDKDEQEEVMEKVWVHYFAKRLSEKNTSIQKLITFNFEKSIIESFVHEVQGKKILEKYWTSKEVLKDINKRFGNKDFGITYDENQKAFVNENGLKEDAERKVCWNIMQIYHEKISGTKVTSDQVIAYIAAAISYTNLQDKALAAVSMDNLYNNKVIANFVISDKANDNKSAVKKSIMIGIMSKVKHLYFKEFQACHMNVRPLTWEDIVEHCKENCMEESLIKYNPETMLVINACQSRDCPHFLKVNSKPLRDHLGGWQEKLPRGFHMYVSNHMSLSDVEVLDSFMKERHIDDLTKFNSSKEEALEYINMVKDMYTKQQKA